MKDYDQSRVIEFLSRADSYGDGGECVKKIDTHISVVFLVGARAFKLKRAVKFPYVDFSSLALRYRNCLAEVAINRRTAPGLYKGVRSVSLDTNGNFSIGGKGEVVDWLVEMARFDEDTLFDRLSLTGKLTPYLMAELAETIARFHLAAKPHPEIDDYKSIEETISGIAESFSFAGGGVLDPATVEKLTADQRAALHGACGEKLKERGKAGLVRHCHGDLHLRNICLIDARPTLFDGIEFNDDFAYIDVLYDLAFLLMDLDHRRLGGLANIVLNNYLDLSGDTDGLVCLALFLSMRAAVRAHVSATVATQQSSTSEAQRLGHEARGYLQLAGDYLLPQKPRLIAIGGLSGSGKSNAARQLAGYIGVSPGARIVRSDVVRKQLAGVAPLSRLDARGYTPDMTRRTYQALYKQTRNALQSGLSVIADAVFADPEERTAIAAVASEMGLPFDGLWLQAPPDVMKARVSARKLNVSDADAAIVQQQLSYDLGFMDWKPVDSSGSKPTTLESTLRALGLCVVMKGTEGA